MASWRPKGRHRTVYVSMVEAAVDGVVGVGNDDDGDEAEVRYGEAAAEAVSSSIIFQDF